MANLTSTRAARLLVAVFAVLALLGLAPSGGAPAKAAVSAAIPSFGSLPVFRLKPPGAVNVDTARRIESFLPGLAALGDTTAISDTTFVGGASTRQILVTNPTSITRNGGQAVQLAQFSASGGFFAENLNAAFPSGAVSRGPFDADLVRQSACNTLQITGLLPPERANQSCQNPADLSDYNVTIQRLATVNPSGAGGTSQETAAIVNVPLSVALPGGFTAAPPRVLLGGPGGHLSLVITALPSFKPRTEAVSDTFSLISDVPGVAAIAAPMYERAPEGKPAATLPQLDINAIIAVLRNTYTNFQPGTPQLIYYLDHPAVPQTLMMPMYTFPDATALIGGEQANLKGLTIPAVDTTSIAPKVVITAPTSGFSYGPGSNTTTVQGTVSGGTGPYTYTLELADGTVVASGVTTGAVNAPNVTLPIDTRQSGTVDQVLRLTATDANGFTSSALLGLRASVHNVWLPLVVQSGGASASAASAPIEPAQGGYRVGVEWVQYYNGTNPDLSGTSPDANGFYNTMRANRRSDDQGFTGSGLKWSNNLAWEKDWKDCSLGGIDCSQIDTVDFAYFSGHGSPARIYFGTSKDSTSFFGGNARYSTLRWAAFSSCQTIRGGPYVSTTPANPPLADWFGAFQGLNELLGFHSNMADIAFGAPVADRMRVPNYFPLNIFPASVLKALQPTIAQAWVDTAFQMNAGKPSYLFVLGTNGRNTSTDKLPLSSEAPPSRPGAISTYNWVWWD